MRATVMRAAGDVRIEDVPDPSIIEPADAILRVTSALHLRQRSMAIRVDGAVRDRPVNARHGREIREQMASSPFAALLERSSATPGGSVLPLTGAA
jgi:hypothetical protein